MRHFTIIKISHSCGFREIFHHDFIVMQYLIQQLELVIPALLQNIRIHSPLTVFLKYDQLDLFKASEYISDYLTSILPKTVWIF